MNSYWEFQNHRLDLHQKTLLIFAIAQQDQPDHIKTGSKDSMTDIIYLTNFLTEAEAIAFFQ